MLIKHTIQVIKRTQLVIKHIKLVINIGKAIEHIKLAIKPPITHIALPIKHTKVITHIILVIIVKHIKLAIRHIILIVVELVIRHIVLMVVKRIILIKLAIQHTIPTKPPIEVSGLSIFQQLNIQLVPKLFLKGYTQHIDLRKLVEHTQFNIQQHSSRSL